MSEIENNTSDEKNENIYNDYVNGRRWLMF